MPTLSRSRGRDASIVWYRGLIAFDADGTDLPAEMAVVDGAIELRVDTAGAMYPVTIDPVIADAEVVRVTPITPVADTVRAGNLLGGIEAVSSCPTGTLLTGLTVYQTPQETNWIRAAAPRCRQVVVTGPTVALGASVVVGPDFGDRTGFFAEQTADCAAGSAVTGFTGNIGTLVDNVALQCSPLGGDGSVGSPFTELPAIGGLGGAPLASPVTCPTSFANGLQGRRGQDVDAIGLQCATVSVVADSAGDQLGFAVDVEGNRMVASAPSADVGAATGAGKVYVYERARRRRGYRWRRSCRPRPRCRARFGDAVAISPGGTRIAVGESDRLGDLAEPGRVFVFELQAGVWNLLAGPVVAPAPAAGDGFGASVAWAGDDRLVIGAPFVSGRGAVYDYTVGGALTAVVPAFGVSPGDDFGFSVAVDVRPGGGHRMIVGSPGWTGDIGAITAYDDVDGLGFDALGSAIITSPLGPPVRLGGSVAVSGNRIAFGSSGGASITGTLYRTENGGAGWIGETTVSVPKALGTPDLSNRFLALEGDVLALGAPGGGGSVNLFRRNGALWPTVPSETVQPAGVEPGDTFGWATALDGALLVVGASGDDGATNEVPDSGAVYTFRLPVTAIFVNPALFAQWEDPTNWDVGVVPGAGDAAVVPFGMSPELGVGVASTIDTLSVTGRLRLRGDLRVETSSFIGEFATVDLQSTATLDPSGDVTLDGELSNGGPVVIDGPGSITGTGRFINDDELRKTGPGTLTLGPGVVWTSRSYSELNVTAGNVEIRGPLFDDNTAAAIDDDVTAGTFRIAAGSSLSFDENLIVGPGTRFVTEITGPSGSTENYGRIVVGEALGFDQTVPNPGSGLVGLEVLLNGYDVNESDVYTVFSCADCAADPPGDANGIEFDNLALSGLTPVQTRNAIDLRTVANKVIAPDPSLGFGTDMAIDGDWAVAARAGAVDVLERDVVTGDWSITQSIPNAGVAGVGRSVAIEGNLIAVVGSVGGLGTTLYRRTDSSSPFVAAEVFGFGGPVSFAGDVAVRDGVVFVTNTAPNGMLIWNPGSSVRFVGSTVLDVLAAQSIAVGGDLAVGTGYAVVGSPDDSAVHVFAQTATTPTIEFGDVPVQTITGPAGSGFGSSVAVSEDRLVVGAPLDGNPVAGAGAAWVYERTGPGATFVGSPVKLQASDADVSDTLGDDVAIDGDVIVVGAPIAQKFAFPLRDGAAYIYQYDGAAWVETDRLRAADGFSWEGFGDAVAVSGNRVLIGAPNDANDNGPDAGAFYSYSITVTGGDPSLALTISPSDPTPAVGVGTIALADLPAAVFQGYGGTTSDYAISDLKTLDLRADLGAPNGGSTPVAEVTLAQLGLDRTPITRRLLNTILLPEIPIEGGWSRALRPNSTDLLVEQTISLLDVHDESVSGGRYEGAVARIELGSLGLQASNLGSISTFAALLAGVSVTQLPFPAGAGTALGYWCGQVDAAGLDCLADFGVDLDAIGGPTGGANLTLPVLSFAGIDIEQADLLGTPLVRPNADGTGDTVVNLAGTPIGDRPLGDLNLGVVPLASQPLVPSKSLPSFIPVTPQIPEDFEDITLGELGGATPLGALTPSDLDLDGVSLSTGDRDTPGTLDLDYRAESPLSDYQWVQPAAGAGLLLASEAPLTPAVSSVKVSDLGADAPLLAVPLDQLILPSGRAFGEILLSELLADTAPFGASPFGASPFGASPFGASPFGASPFGASPFGASPFGPVPFGASPFGASPFGASPFGASPFGASPFGASPFGASPFGASPFGASPFGASPFGASPFGASPFGASPFGASPFGASPFGASPFGASPFGASPFGASPFGASPFGASRLSELGLSAPVVAIPLGGTVGGKPLGTYELGELDRANLLFDLPIQPFIGTTLIDCSLIDCRQPNGFTIGSAFDAGALRAVTYDVDGVVTMDRAAQLGDIQPGLYGLTVADLVGAHPAFTSTELGTFMAANTTTLADAEQDPALQLQGIPIQLLDAYRTATIEDARLLFSGWRLVDFGGLAVGLELADLEAALTAWDAAQEISADPVTIGDLTRKIELDDLDGIGNELFVDTLALSTVAKAAPALTVDDVWPLLQPLRVEHLRLVGSTAEPTIGGAAASRTIGQVQAASVPLPVAQPLQGLLWGDIIGSADTDPLPSATDVTIASILGSFRGVTLGEFLRAAQPITDQDTSVLDLGAVDLADYSNATGVDLSIGFRLDGTARPDGVRLVATLPAGSRYVEGSAVLTGGATPTGTDAPIVEPTLFGDTLVWLITNVQPGVDYTLDFGVRSPAETGTVTASVSGQLQRRSVFASSNTAISFREAFEPNDLPTDVNVATIGPDEIFLSQISTATDVDLYRFDVTTPGTRIGATLSNLPADYDLAIIGPSTHHRRSRQRSGARVRRRRPARCHRWSDVGDPDGCGPVPATGRLEPGGHRPFDGPRHVGRADRPDPALPGRHLLPRRHRLRRRDERQVVRPAARDRHPDAAPLRCARRVV